MHALTLRRLIEQTLVALLIAFLGLSLIYPIVLTIWGGFAKTPGKADGWTFVHVARVFRDPSTLEGLTNAFWIAVGTTLLSAAIALPLALLSARHRFPFKATFSAFVLVPLILPPFVGAIGFRAIVGREGMINALLGTDWDVMGQAKALGVIIVQALHLYPILYLNATAALANLDPAMNEAAENLGAGPWRRFTRITLPLIRPGLFAGGTIVFIWAFTELGTPLMFDYDRVTAVQIFYGLSEVEGSARPYALTFVLLASSLAAYAAGKLAFGRRGYAMSTRATRAASEVPIKGVKGWLASGLFLVVTLLAVAPHVGVVLMSFTNVGQWYQTVLPTSLTLAHYGVALGSDVAFRSIANSLFYSFLAVALNTAIGVTVGYLLVRTKAVGRGVLDTLCMLPLAVPGLVMAFGFVAVSLAWPFRGTLDLGFFSISAPLDGVISVVGVDPNPIPLLVLAYAVRRLPYIVRSVVAGLEQTSGEMEEAALNLGATRLRAIRSVVLPLILANIIAGALLVFAFSMLEVSDSLLLAQKQDDWPITRAIYAFSNRQGDGPSIASAMGVWGMALLTLTLVGASALLGKKMGAIFRV
ncbi:MAG: iron ABC transporter permease [Phycisphaeraceae bacterium]|nr:iron ABC transporter permease [Phycisphaeraceae bacterium]